MTNQELPFASIVITTFNRGNQIVACLESLKKQTYPKDRYEIIVVDDGSTDETPVTARSQGVQLIRHNTNRGISSARNTGLAAAKGEITVYIDDDAIADSQWLEHLAQPFQSPEISASGGQTFAFKTDSITERYLSTIGYGNPAPLAFGKSKDPLWRFWIYLKSMFVPFGIAIEPAEVEAVYGLNCAYRTSALRATGGFDERMFADEDTEISTRLRRSGAHIMFVPDAIIHHRHRERLGQLLRQTYFRAGYTVYYYAKEGKIPPIFPLPLFYVVVATCLLILAPIVGCAFLVLGPLLLYSWWPIRAVRDNKLEYLLYGYIQLALESAAILGMIRGKFRKTKTKFA